MGSREAAFQSEKSDKYKRNKGVDIRMTRGWDFYYQKKLGVLYKSPTGICMVC
jgi:hypothetical protein